MKKLTFKNKNFITVIILVALSMAVLFVLTRPKKEVKWAVTPHVVVNNEIYSYGFSDLCYEEGKLPEDYIEIGHVKSTVSASENAPNWGSNACDAGDVIYKSPNNPNEILVYTKLFAGDKYRYLGFGTEDNEEAVLPLVRYLDDSSKVEYAKSYTFETAYRDADAVAIIRVGNWLGENTEIYESYYEVVTLECYKGEMPEKFTLLQAGTSEGLLEGHYPLFTHGNELFVFLKKADLDDYESPYWIIGLWRTLLDVAYDEEGVRYFADRYGSLGYSMVHGRVSDSRLIRTVGDEVYAWSLAADPVIAAVPYTYQFIFTQEDIENLLAISSFDDL